MKATAFIFLIAIVQSCFGGGDVNPKVAGSDRGENILAYPTNCLYYRSTNQFDTAVQNEPATWTDGRGSMYISRIADIRILGAHISSDNNENTRFSVILNTSDYHADPKSVFDSRPFVLRVGKHWYAQSTGGWNSNGEFEGYDTAQTNGENNMVGFVVLSEGDAQELARWLSAPCRLRSPPGYKLLAQFIPSKTEFNTNEPVMVKFQLKNLDERTIIFQRGGQQEGTRDNQYGFQAMMYDHIVPDIGNPVSIGGPCGPVSLDSGKVFEDQIDLKKWFAFDKPGIYMIHGFYQLDFYQPPLNKETFWIWNPIWHDYASADFRVDVK
jgi:hypothetical protein